MAKKSSSLPAGQASKKPVKNPLLASERTLSKIGKLLELPNFKSIDEANKFLQNMIGKPDSLNDPFLADKRNPLDEAQEIMYDAFDEENSQKRIKLAKKALSVSKDCADAYNLLAEEAPSLEEAKELYHNGIAAGKRSIGEKAFEEMKGHFWGYHETRPFMRTMAGLSNVLWSLNQKQESVDVIKEMLVLNPYDNQGMRYSLINKLLVLRKLSEAEDLLNEYMDDHSAYWYYSRAYLYFCKPSKKFAADKELIKAMKFNPYVPLYLFGIKEMPKILPDFIGIGDDNEAIEYADVAFEVWGSNESAYHWFAGLYKKMENELNQLIIKKEKERQKRFKDLGK
ncbi:MAG: hypothetical protein AB1775_00450 [Bacteroidota bacterium]